MLIRAKRGTWDHLLRPLGALWAYVVWLFTGKGPLSSLSVQVACFVRSDDMRSVDAHAFPFL